jgi:hypothetical protein
MSRHRPTPRRHHASSDIRGSHTWETEGGPRRGRAHELLAAPARSPLASGDRQLGRRPDGRRSRAFGSRAPAGHHLQSPCSISPLFTHFAVENKRRGGGDLQAAGHRPPTLGSGRRGLRRACSARWPPRPPLPPAGARAHRPWPPPGQHSEGEGVNELGFDSPPLCGLYMRRLPPSAPSAVGSGRTAVMLAGCAAASWVVFSSRPSRGFLGLWPI